LLYWYFFIREVKLNLCTAKTYTRGDGRFLFDGYLIDMGEGCMLYKAKPARKRVNAL
jgi:hypothetical protein